MSGKDLQIACLVECDGLLVLKVPSNSNNNYHGYHKRLLKSTELPSTQVPLGLTEITIYLSHFRNMQQVSFLQLSLFISLPPSLIWAGSGGLYSCLKNCHWWAEDISLRKWNTSIYLATTGYVELTSVERASNGAMQDYLSFIIAHCWTLIWQLSESNAFVIFLTKSLHTLFVVLQAEIC